MLIVWMWVCNNNHLCPHHSVLIFWWMLKGKDSITLSMEFHTLVKNELYISRFHEKHNFNHNFTIITLDTTCIIKQCTNTSSPCFHLQPRQMKCIHKNLDNLLWSSFSPKTINYQKFYYTPHTPPTAPFISLHNINFWILKGTCEWFFLSQLLRPSFDTF